MSAVPPLSQPTLGIRARLRELGQPQLKVVLPDSQAAPADAVEPYRIQLLLLAEHYATDIGRLRDLLDAKSGEVEELRKKVDIHLRARMGLLRERAGLVRQRRELRAQREELRADIERLRLSVGMATAARIAEEHRSDLLAEALELPWYRWRQRRELRRRAEDCSWDGPE